MFLRPEMTRWAGRGGHRGEMKFSLLLFKPENRWDKMFTFLSGDVETCGHPRGGLERGGVGDPESRRIILRCGDSLYCGLRPQTRQTRVK